MGIPIWEKVGENVTRLRTQLDLSQADLEHRLSGSGGKWTRTAVGMLESKGLRGERMSDLIQLCIALDQPLKELLAGDGTVVLRDGTEHDLSFVRSALLESRNPSIFVSHKAPLKVGEHDPKESARLARSIQAPESNWTTLLDYIKKVTSAPPSVTAYRDFLAAIEPQDDREEARRKRISGTRKLKAKAAELHCEPTPAEIAAERTRWINWRTLLDEAANANADDDQ